MKRQWIKMLKDDKGADEGHTVRQYKEGEEVEVTEDLAKSFLSTKSCKLIDGPTPKKAEKDDKDDKKPEKPKK